jgi:hypothetical protein
VLKSGVRGENGIVRLDHRSSRLRSGVHAELELALLAVVDREALHEESTETRTSTTTKGVEDEEALKTNTVVGDTSHLVQNGVNELLAHGVVSPSIVVRSVFLSGDHLLGVEQAPVSAGADLVDDIGLEIAVDGAGDVLALAYDAWLERCVHRM